MRKLIFIMSILSIFILSCGKKENSDNNKDKKTKITVVLDWTPNTNHTGLYVAKELGYFEEEGLEVTIIQPGNGTSDQLVASGKAQFGVSYQESVTLARIEDIPIVSIAAVIQHNTSGFYSRADKGIKTPKDFENKKYGGWGSPIEKATLKALMDKENADVEKVKIITSGDTDFFAVSEKSVDFAWGFEAWTGMEAKVKNIPVNYIRLSDYNKNLDYYTPVIITNEKMIADNKEIVEKFMRATKKGYEYSSKNPLEAANILMKNAPELNKELVEKSQEFLAKEYQSDASYWGEQKKEVWENYTNWLYDNKLIDKKIDVDKAFTNEFLTNENLK
ncbi:MAG: ABC transporter substrate-binding protein [Sebaldella sp.]|nr:ABC transporter substrate-binding protein [Sebaldella sp.]